MRALIFGIFAAIVITVFVNMSGDALNVNAALSDNMKARYEQINE